MATAWQTLAAIHSFRASYLRFGTIGKEDGRRFGEALREAARHGWLVRTTEVNE